MLLFVKTSLNLHLQSLSTPLNVKFEQVILIIVNFIYFYRWFVKPIKYVFKTEAIEHIRSIIDDLFLRKKNPTYLAIPLFICF